MNKKQKHTTRNQNYYQNKTKNITKKKKIKTIIEK